MSKCLKRMEKPETLNLWVIGYGNCHRRDDGAGRHVADHLISHFRAVAGVRVLSLHQLGPELAEDLQAAGGIVFIDAALTPQSRGRAWRRIRPVTDMADVSHSLTAAVLLGLIQLLYGRCPPAWMVSIPGEDFGFGHGLRPGLGGSCCSGSPRSHPCHRLQPERHLLCDMGGIT